MCLDRSEICDATIDCPHHEDEENCSEKVKKILLWKQKKNIGSCQNNPTLSQLSYSMVPGLYFEGQSGMDDNLHVNITLSMFNLVFH